MTWRSSFRWKEWILSEMVFVVFHNSVLYRKRFSLVLMATVCDFSRGSSVFMVLIVRPFLRSMSDSVSIRDPRHLHFFHKSFWIPFLNPMKPFIVLKGMRREVSQLNEEFHGKCFVASSENGWINTSLTNEFVQKVLSSLSLSTCLFVWDTFDCHTEDSVSESLKQKKIESLHIPEGYTKYVQAPDVSWNKP